MKNDRLRQPNIIDLNRGNGYSCSSGTLHSKEEWKAAPSPARRATRRDRAGRIPGYVIYEIIIRLLEL
jgi:hypothetical protein